VSKILIIDDEEAIREILNITLTDRGHETLLAANGAKGIEIFKQEKPDITITDIRMPGIDGIEVLKKIKAIQNDAHVMIITAYGNEDIAVSALRQGAVDYIKKPFNPYELEEAVKKIIAIQEIKKLQEISANYVVEEVKKIIMPSHIHLIPGIIKQLVLNVKNKYKHFFNLEFGLYEIILNAIEHGNFNINQKQKELAIAKGYYRDLLKEKMVNPEYSNKKVFIKYSLDPDRLKYVIRDEGEGFQWQKIPPVSSPMVFSKKVGKGIIIAKFSFDEVKFNLKGNEATLIKYPKLEEL